MTILNTIILQSQTDFVVDYKLIMTVISALSGAIIGGGVTIWYKNKEFKSFSETLRLQIENLNLQKQMFQETLVNNELKLKAELVRLEDLNRQYQLSIHKHDFEHLSKVLDFANDKDEKVAMMKEFVEKLSKYNPRIPDWVDDYSEYQECIVTHVYYSLDVIRTDIETLLKNHVSAFVLLHSNFNQLVSDVNNVKREISQYTMHFEDIDIDTVIAKCFKNLFKLHEDYNNLLELMKEEFKELGKMKSDYIKSQFTIRTKE